MKKVLVLGAMMLTAVISMAKDIKTVVVTTQPQMHCESCEKKITGNLRFEKGVKQISGAVSPEVIRVASLDSSSERGITTHSMVMFRGSPKFS